MELFTPVRWDRMHPKALTDNSHPKAWTSMSCRIGALVLLTVLAVAGASAQGEVLDNARIVQMTKLGLPPEVIVARIKSSERQFSLTDADLVALSKAGVAGSVVAAMLESAVRTVAEVRIDERVISEKTLAQVNSGGFKNRLASSMTGGLITTKSRAYLPGPFSETVVGPTAKIDVAVPKGESIDKYLLVRLTTRKDKRELEIGSLGTVSGAKSGLSSKEIVATEAVASPDGRYQLLIPTGLVAGEYMIYVLGSADAIKGIYGRGYDFSVR